MRSMAAAVLLAAAPALAQTFIPIPDLPGGTTLSRARAISPDGTVAVGISNSASGDEAMRWVIAAPGAGGLSDLPGGAFSSEAQACSNNGVVFGWGTNAAGNLEAFRWSPSPGMQPLGFLPSGGYSSRIYGCSADGAAACGENLFQPNGVPPPLPVTQALRWTEGGGMQGLGFLPGASFYSSARAISADGSVVVGIASDSSFANRPFYWTQAGGMIDISGGQYSGTARGVSSDGQWVVGSDSGAGFATLWNVSLPPGVYTALAPLPFATSAAAADVSDDARTIVGASGGRAVMWVIDFTSPVPATDLTTYAPAGWTLQVAHGVSGNGRTIAGYGLNPQGQTQGFVIVLPNPNCDTTIADYNGDGDVGTDQDIEAFFSCLGGNCCPACHARGADVNGDGDVGTDQDIEAFFRCIGGNCCF